LQIGKVAGLSSGETLMTASWRERRRAELAELWNADPSKIIGLYQRTTAHDVLESLPPGITLAEVLDAIVEREQQRMPAAEPEMSSQGPDPGASRA